MQTKEPLVTRQCSGSGGPHQHRTDPYPDFQPQAKGVAIEARHIRLLEGSAYKDTRPMPVFLPTPSGLFALLPTHHVSTKKWNHSGKQSACVHQNPVKTDDSSTRLLTSGMRPI